jgi:hypothetical protein
METVQMCSVYIPGSAGVVEADDGGADAHSHVHHLQVRSETVKAKGTQKRHQRSHVLDAVDRINECKLRRCCQRGYTLQIFWAWVSLREPPNTVKSWLKMNTCIVYA